jgi:hypothetical protein
MHCIAGPARQGQTGLAMGKERKVSLGCTGRWQYTIVCLLGRDRKGWTGHGRRRGMCNPWQGCFEGIAGLDLAEGKRKVRNGRGKEKIARLRNKRPPWATSLG